MLDSLSVASPLQCLISGVDCEEPIAKGSMAAGVKVSGRAWTINAP